MKKHYSKDKKRRFWEKEYDKEGHLALSARPSEDLAHFTRWLTRREGSASMNPLASVLDLGAGNGRNLIYLAQNFGVRGVGYDISEEAIALAKKASVGLPLSYEARSIAHPLPLADESQTIVLDMMTSHLLSAVEREHLLQEIKRVLKPGGWLFFKTFLLEEDLHAKRLLRDHPAPEAGSYIHPEIGTAEHVFTVSEIKEILADGFTIHKTQKSHKHMRKGRAWKRRSISVYAQKI